MLDGHSNGNGPRIQLIHGEVVIEQELDDDGRAGRWRRLILTIPLHVGGVTISSSFAIDLPDSRQTAETAEVARWPAGTWAEAVERMGGVKPGGNDED